ncbi:MAG TPA: divalent-cation tolerance protein CutA [Vicinamibacterales bacterium]|nr:divalent-cation tolerance protein CutA [Vicinamibacterales bacterium]
MHPRDPVLVLTTWPAASDPGPFATTLVAERLAACVNLLPEMESVYRWQGAVERERERQVLIKTTADRLEALGARLTELHPYQVPELLVLPVSTGSEPYLGWVRESTSA